MSSRIVVIIRGFRRGKEDEMKNLMRSFFVAMFIVVIPACAEFRGGCNENIPDEVMTTPLWVRVTYSLDPGLRSWSRVATGGWPTISGFVETVQQDGDADPAPVYYHQARDLNVCALNPYAGVRACQSDRLIQLTDGVEKLRVLITAQLEAPAVADVTIRVRELPARPELSSVFSPGPNGLQMNTGPHLFRPDQFNVRGGTLSLEFLPNGPTR